MAQLDNAADSDSEERGFESLRAGQKKQGTDRCLVFLLIKRDSNPERVRSVKKTARWAVFSDEVGGGYCCEAAVADDAGLRSRPCPSAPAKVKSLETVDI